MQLAHTPMQECYLNGNVTGMSTEADLILAVVARNVATLGDKCAGMARAISYVIRLLRLYQCVCACLRWCLITGPGYPLV